MFMKLFISRILFQTFCKNSKGQYNDAREFVNEFKDVMKPHLSNSKYFREFHQKLEKEMQKFIGKLTGDGTETNSEMTTATRQTKGSSTKQSQQLVRSGSPGIDELDEAATMQHADREDYEGKKDSGGDEEDAIQEELAAQNKKEDGRDLRHLYVDPATRE